MQAPIRKANVSQKPHVWRDRLKSIKLNTNNDIASGNDMPSWVQPINTASGSIHATDLLFSTRRSLLDSYIERNRRTATGQRKEVGLGHREEHRGGEHPHRQRDRVPARTFYDAWLRGKQRVLPALLFRGCVLVRLRLLRPQPRSIRAPRALELKCILSPTRPNVSRKPKRNLFSAVGRPQQGAIQPPLRRIDFFSALE